jgi:pilus assembly protein CpaB
MRRGALLLVIGIIVLLGIVALFVLGPMFSGPTTTTEGTPTITPTPPSVKVLVALQDIQRGQPIPEEVIGERQLVGTTTKEAIDQGMLIANDNNREYMKGKIARQDIKNDQVIQRDFVLDAANYLRGSEASLFIPQGMVAVAFPVDRLASVAYAIQPGDHIDVLATFQLINVDPDLQTALPNYTALLKPDGSLSEPFAVGVAGTLPPDDTPINMGPGPTDPYQRPRAVTQLTLENVLVLRFGEWPQDTGPTPVPTAVVTGTRAAQAQNVVPATATLVPKPDIVTLALPRQDALVLMYLLHTGTTIEFALRPAGDVEVGFNLQPVTLAYTFQRFQIEEPPKLPYATEPGLWPLRLAQGVGGQLFPTPPPHPNPTPAARP